MKEITAHLVWVVQGEVKGLALGYVAAVEVEVAVTMEAAEAQAPIRRPRERMAAGAGRGIVLGGPIGTGHRFSRNQFGQR